jgi:hypothetical protein
MHYWIGTVIGGAVLLVLLIAYSGSLIILP